METFEEALAEVRALRASHEAMQADHAACKDRIEIMAQQLTELDALVRGRNKSAATKRNMTNDDARAVLDGPYRELDHKAAAEAAGLTYAQVYSCRLEFTFKHVHKDLRDLKWKSPWARDEAVHRS